LIIYVLDSDYYTLKSYEQYLENIPGDNYIKLFTNSKQLVEASAIKEPDIAIVDVNLQNSISASKTLKEINKNIKIIFASTEDIRSESVFQTYASDFLKKPFSIIDLQKIHTSISRPLAFKHR